MAVLRAFSVALVVIFIILATCSTSVQLETESPQDVISEHLQKIIEAKFYAVPADKLNMISRLLLEEVQKRSIPQQYHEPEEQNMEEDIVKDGQRDAAEDEEFKDTGGFIAVVVVVSIVVVAVVIGLLCCCVRRRKNKKKQNGKKDVDDVSVESEPEQPPPKNLNENKQAPKIFLMAKGDANLKKPVQKQQSQPDDVDIEKGIVASLVGNEVKNEDIQEQKVDKLSEVIKDEIHMEEESVLEDQNVEFAPDILNENVQVDDVATEKDVLEHHVDSHSAENGPLHEDKDISDIISNVSSVKSGSLHVEDEEVTPRDDASSNRATIEDDIVQEVAEAVEHLDANSNKELSLHGGDHEQELEDRKSNSGSENEDKSSGANVELSSEAAKEVDDVLDSASIKSQRKESKESIKTEHEIEIGNSVKELQDQHEENQSVADDIEDKIPEEIEVLASLLQ